MAEIHSAQNGNSNDPTTWVSGDVPKFTDDVFIDHIVTVAADHIWKSTTLRQQLFYDAVHQVIVLGALVFGVSAQQTGGVIAVDVGVNEITLIVGSISYLEGVDHIVTMTSGTLKIKTLELH